MRKKFTHKNWIALVLSLVLIVWTFPINVIALDLTPVIANISNSNKTTDNSVMIADSLEYTDDVTIGEVVEITALREENVKHFRLADGTYEAVMYTHPIHRQDKNGVWQDIDNNLSLTDDGTLKKYSTSDSRVKFADSFKINSELFVLSENGYSISMSLVGDEASSKLSSSSTAQIVSPINPIITNSSRSLDTKTFTSLDEAARINNKSSIIYNNVKSNTAIEYVLQGNDLKENIIVSAPCENYEYQFQMNLSGLEAALDDGGNINLYDSKSGQSKYVIPAPYMYDNNGETSTSVSYELNWIKGGVYILTVSADEDWMNSSNRAFPVTIDPSIIIDAIVEDAYTYSAYPNQNYGYDEKLWVSDGRTSYIHIENLPTLPSGAVINYAYFYVYYYYYVATGQMLVGAYQVLEDWDEATITYNNAPAISTTLFDSHTLLASTAITESSPGLVGFNIVEIISDWYDGSSTNFGIAVKRESSTTNTNTSVILKSYEANEDYAYIRVNYTYYIPDGVYALQNNSVTTRWMTVEADSVYAGKHIQQVYSDVSPESTNVFDRSSLFKISHIYGTDRYIIRSMLNNNLSFGISGTEIITKTIPSADDDVAEADTFYIEWDGYGFLLRPSGSSNVINMASTATANLTTIDKTNATSSARWTFVQYTGAHRHGLALYRPSSWASVGIIAGTTSTSTLVGWCTYIDANTLSMDVTAGYEDLGTLVWDAAENKATISASNPGKFKVNGRIKYADGTQVTAGTFTHMIVPQEGTYYVQNASTEKYIDIKGPSTSEGAIIHQWQYHTGNQAKWNIEHVSNSGGYIRLKSAYSNLYIGVDSSDTSVIKQYSTQNDYTLWKIDRTAIGNLVFTCKATESSGVALSVPLTANSNGTNLTQITYTDNTDDKDEWHLYKLSGYTVNVSVIYDYAYSNRYSNASSRISNQILALQEKYMQDFGIVVNAVSPTLFSCYADTYCTTDPTVQCTHNSEPCLDSGRLSDGTIVLNSLHHTNIRNIMYHIPFPDLSSTVKVAYIGHTLCTKDNHTGQVSYGLTNKYIGLATIMNFSSEASETKTFIHEFGHFYYVEDHYGNGCKTTDEMNAEAGSKIYNENCIYGENKETPSVLNNFTICDGCKATIKNNISRFDHE